MEFCETCGLDVTGLSHCPACRARELLAQAESIRRRVADIDAEIEAHGDDIGEPPPPRFSAAARF